MMVSAMAGKSKVIPSLNGSLLMFKKIREITDIYYLGNSKMSEQGLSIMLTAYTYDSYNKSGKSWLDPLAKTIFLDNYIPIS